MTDMTVTAEYITPKINGVNVSKWLSYSHVSVTPKLQLNNHNRFNVVLIKRVHWVGGNK